MKVDVETVRIPPRHRQLVAEKIDQLAVSMEAIGLMTPITCYEVDSFPHLVAGWHRLEAAKKLGWQEIEAVFMDAEAVEHEVWEIDENLARAGLSAVEEAQHIARRAELIELLPRKSFPQLQIAEEIQQTERSVRTKKKRAKEVSEHAQETLKGTDHDKGVVLDELQNFPPDEQDAIAERIVETDETVDEAAEFVTGESAEEKATAKQLKSLQNAWKRADEPAREQFMNWLKSYTGAT